MTNISETTLGAADASLNSNPKILTSEENLVPMANTSETTHGTKGNLSLLPDAGEQAISFSKPKPQAGLKNGRCSPGPKTLRGKRFSSQNARKHGFFSQNPAIEQLGESPKMFANLLKGLREEFSPVGPSEDFLVHMMATGMWKKQRLFRFEKFCMASRYEKEPGDSGAWMVQETEALLPDEGEESKLRAV